MKAPAKRVLLWLLGAVLVAAVVGAGVFLWWGLHPLGPSPSALAALQSDDQVTVTKTSAGWEFAPANKQFLKPDSAYIFYPGGHVDARSYAPYLRDVAVRGFLVVEPEMPLSLAVLDPNAASRAISAHPEIKKWTLGGHSLGGVMAASFVQKNASETVGLVLLASYPANGTDLSSRKNLHVSSLLGTQDTVVNRTAWEAGRKLLPPTTRFVMLEGGNHGQFGDYGVQPGDTADPKMSAKDQRTASVEWTLQTLRPR
jgi:predicted esterase